MRIVFSFNCHSTTAALNMGRTDKLVVAKYLFDEPNGHEIRRAFSAQYRALQTSIPRRQISHFFAFHLAHDVIDDVQWIVRWDLRAPASA